MKKNIKFGIIFAAYYFVLSTTIAYAQNVGGPSSALMDSGTNLSELIQNIIGILGNVVPLLIGAAVVVFLWGVLVFIAKASAGDAEGRKQGINFMIFGIIGIAVMVSLWGLVAFVTNTFGVTGGVPQFNSGGTINGLDDPNDTSPPNEAWNNTT